MPSAQKVSTCLWFDTQAEEAAQLYVSLLPESRITAVSRYGKGAHMPEGTVLTVTFELAGTEFMALNGGPQFKFSEATSLVIRAATARPRSTACGARCSPTAARSSSAAGSRTATGCPGRSFRAA
jgi:predicted 3-demethylubiquinone-9 3-methyltransferase (glyoxalase superfamily)